MNRLKPFCGLVIATSAIFASLSAPARGQKAISVEDILDLHRVNDIQLSPDGKQAAIVLSLPGNGVSDKGAGVRIWIRQTSGTGDLRPLDAGVQGDNSPRWSPDGRYLGFLSSRPVNGQSSNGNDQVFIVPSNGGAAKRITQMPGGVSWFTWSPDSTMVAFLAPDASSNGPASEPSTSNLIDQPFTPSRLWVVNVATGNSTLALKLSTDIEDFAWAPDSKRFAVLSDSAPSNDGTSSTSLMIADRQSGEVLRTFNVNAQDSPQSLRWSPDGKLIAFQQKAPQNNAFWWSVIPAEGGDSHPLLKNYRATFSNWSSPKTLSMCSWKRRLERVRPSFP
jgi:dipeptidyl aminopeptidase/acylaminoacyl peptidase